MALSTGQLAGISQTNNALGGGAVAEVGKDVRAEIAQVCAVVRNAASDACFARQIRAAPRRPGAPDKLFCISSLGVRDPGSWNPSSAFQTSETERSKG